MKPIDDIIIVLQKRLIWKLQPDKLVKIFILDMLLGSLSTIILLLLIISLYVLRTRRSIGPLFLLLSSLTGITGSLLFILDKSEILDTPDLIQMVLFIGWFVGTIISLSLWRKR